MTSTIIPLITPADRALAQELFSLWSKYHADKKFRVELRDCTEVRLAKHRLSALLQDEPPPPDTPAPYWKGKMVVGESPCDAYHWRKCE